MSEQSKRRGGGGISVIEGVGRKEKVIAYNRNAFEALATEIERQR